MRIPVFLLDLDLLHRTDITDLHTEMQDRETINFGVFKYDRLDFLVSFMINFIFVNTPRQLET